MVRTLLECSRDTHHYGLAIGSLLTAVAVAFLPNDRRRSNRTLGEIVFKRNVRLVQKSKQVVGVSAQTFG